MRCVALILTAFIGCSAAEKPQEKQETAMTFPVTLSGAAPVVWYDASDATKTTIVSSRISQHVDSQTAAVYSQATTTKRPNVSAAARNGYDAHNYERARIDVLENTSFSALNAKSGATVVMAIKFDGITDNQVPLHFANFCLTFQQISGALNVYASSGNFGTCTQNSTGWRIFAARFDGSQTGNSNRLKVWLDAAAQSLTFTGTIPATSTTSNGVYFGCTTTTPAFDGLIGEIVALDYAATDQDITDITDYLTDRWVTLAVTHNASNSGFVYHGHWITSGTERHTMTNASSCQFTYTGDGCVLAFDVSQPSINYPAIAYSVDGSQWTRATFTSSGTVTISPPRNSASSPAVDVHEVRFLTSIPSGFDNYTNMRDAIRFRGITLDAGESLLTTTVHSNTIEFLGDSITAGFLLLYTGTTGVVANAPELCYPEITARRLGMVPVVVGHSGQGITQASTDGTPAANAAFGMMASGQSYTPAVDPVATVVYMGTNDSTLTQNQYQTYLSTIRAAYPDTIIFAVVPDTKAAHASTISAAVTALADSDIVYLDHSGTLSASDKVDGIHPNPGGAIRMATRLATDIQAEFASRGVKLQAAAAGGGSNTTEWAVARELLASAGINVVRL